MGITKHGRYDWPWQETLEIWAREKSNTGKRVSAWRTDLARWWTVSIGVYGSSAKENAENCAGRSWRNSSTRDIVMPWEYRSGEIVKESSLPRLQRRYRWPILQSTSPIQSQLHYQCHQRIMSRIWALEFRFEKGLLLIIPLDWNCLSECRSVAAILLQEQENFVRLYPHFLCVSDIFQIDCCQLIVGVLNFSVL